MTIKLPDLPCCFQTSHNRHFQVHQDKIKLPVADLLDSFHPIGYPDNIVIFENMFY